MKIYFTKHFPFGKFRAISLFGRMWYKDPTGEKRADMLKHPERYFRLVQHETTHWEQQKEMLIIFFFVWYVAEWFIKLFTEGGKAYHNLSFEREARHCERYPDNYFIPFFYGRKKPSELTSLEFIVKTRSLEHRDNFDWVFFIFHRDIK